MYRTYASDCHENSLHSIVVIVMSNINIERKKMSSMRCTRWRINVRSTEKNLLAILCKELMTMFIHTQKCRFPILTMVMCFYKSTSKYARKQYKFRIMSE